ncbi:serine--tRNA ligase [Candidatus Woesearchaeota archaeon]|nr:MAG: serine--tRNA ligase [Candidatus Woesearchaeota archaeon]
MLELNYIREYPDIVRKNLEKRQEPDKIKLLDKLLKTDEKWRALKKKTDELRARRNKLSKEINEAKKKNKDATTLLKEAKEIPKELEKTEKELEKLQAKVKDCLMRIPNLLEPSVPYGKDDTENVTIREVGEKPKFDFEPLDHVALMEKWGLADLERAAKISGARFYFILGKLARLELALLSYAADFLMKRGFLLTSPPYMINKKAYEGVTSLDDFEDELYKIEGEDLYCIATSEHPLISQFRDEILEEDELPKKLAGISPCFRKEAGTHGREDKGIFRVHQFNKVEQIILCKPEESIAFFDELLKNIEDFFQSLGIPYRIVNICTGDIGIVAAKKYDLEGWMPGQNKYRELGSCSNCTSYQAVRSNIKFLRKNKREYVHTLNNTCVATERALVAILENFQDENGVVHIPEVLQKYCGFKTIGGED